jgi:glycosyltransferase involved in cell wall biosynthesis
MCVNISNVLYGNGFESVICASHEGGPLQKFIDPGVKCYILNKKRFFDIKTFRHFIKILKAEKIDVIHAHSSSVFWAVTAKAFIPGLYIIWHDHLGLKVTNREKSIFYRLISKKVNGIISVNHDLLEWSKKNMKVSSERIMFLNNFPVLNEEPKFTDTEYYTIVCLANLRPQKDHETLIRSIGILVKNEMAKPVKVIFAGSFKEDECLFRIKDLINRLGLNSTIEIAGPVEDIAALLARADCGVLSSVSEGLPVSLLEYGLAALPVVVTDVGQCAEVTGNGKYGIVVPPGNPEAMSDALLYIINNRGTSEKTGASFKKHVQKNYGPDNFIEKYKFLLNKIAINA